MRLYKLLSRCGRKRSALGPWVDEPLAVSPEDFAGWHWDNKLFKWVSIPMEPVKTVAFVIMGPRPTQLPSRAFSSVQPGWEYNFELNEWMAVLAAEHVMEFTPPLPMTPQQLSRPVEARYGYMTDWFEMQMMLKTMGYTGAELDVFMDQLEMQLQGLSFEARKAVKYKVIADVVKTWKATRFMNVTGTGYLWRRQLEEFAKSYTPQIGGAATIAILGIVAALFGALVGLTLESLTTAEEGWIVFKDFEETFLFGPEEWYYAGFAGYSPAGSPYYRLCEEIGATNAHHLRAPGKISDRIAFTPGGFLEEGWHGGKFVKYRWEFWMVEYKGFLIKSTGILYRLQHPDVAEWKPEYSYLVDPELVCWDFRKDYL